MEANNFLTIKQANDNDHNDELSPKKPVLMHNSQQRIGSVATCSTGPHSKTLY